MRKIFLSLVLIFLINLCYAQYNPRPTKSRFFNSKHSTFETKPGDMLIYSFINDSNQVKELVVTVNKWGNGISYNYKMEGAPSGEVTISNNAFLNATDYTYDFTGNGNSIWLSKKNWRDLASKDKTTSMKIGNDKETFVRDGASTLKIKYRGEEKILTVYNIISNSNVDRKTFTILTDEKNPLITSMNLGWTMTLKEVR